MKKHFNFFVASVFCSYGILGGWIDVEEEKLVYRTTKLVMPPEYKVIEMKYVDIEKVEPKWWLIFPTVKLTLNDGRAYKFIVFSRKKFVGIIKARKIELHSETIV